MKKESGSTQDVELHCNILLIGLFCCKCRRHLKELVLIPFLS